MTILAKDSLSKNSVERQYVNEDDFNKRCTRKMECEIEDLINEQPTIEQGMDI